MTSECGLGKGNLKQPSQFHIISVNDTCSTPNSSLHIRFWSGMLTNQVYLAKPARCFHMVYLDSSFLTLVIRAAIFSHQPLWNSTIPQGRNGKILWLWSSWTSSCWNNRPVPVSWNYNLKCYLWMAPVGDYEDFMALCPKPKALVLSHRTNVTRSSASASHVTVLVLGRIAYQLPRSRLKTGGRRRLLICTWWFQDVI